jgi:hypothetical protein
MNQLTTYEQLIAAKLQELSAPAKIDAIWARIEQQLDVEMPTDESGPTDTEASSNPGFFFPGSKFLYIFLAAVASIYFLTRPYAIQNEASETTDQQPYEISDSVNTVSDPKKKSDSEIMFTDKADISVTNEALPKDSIPDDVLESIPNEVIKKEPESIVQPPVSNPVNEIKKSPIPIITDTTVKKGRGVKGINLSDYKIAPVKKDNQP